MAWSLVNKASVGAAGAAAVATTSGIVTTNADVIWLAICSYSLATELAGLTDSPAGTFGDAANTWTLIGATDGTGAGDASLFLTTFRCISPTTGTSHKFRYDPTVGTGGYVSIVVFALTQGSAPTYVTSVSNANNATTIKPGSIGNANDLVCEGVGFYSANGYSIDNSFNDLTEVAYGTAMGVAAAWKQVSGAVDATFTASSANKQVARGDSFTGTGGGGGGSTYPGADGCGVFYRGESAGLWLPDRDGRSELLRAA